MIAWMYKWIAALHLNSRKGVIDQALDMGRFNHYPDTLVDLGI